MNALDTNILVYAHDSRDPRKQTIALQLIKTVRPLALPWQVGCEFLAASRKLQAMTRDDAWDALDDFRQLVQVILIPEAGLWSQCRGLEQKYVLSFWDALLVGACLKGGVQTLYSEDLGVASRTIPGLALINPFA